jgi:alkyl hydroperoxide reductase subunit D
MNWVDQIKVGLPDYAKDTSLNIDAVMKRSTLPAEEAEACALAAAFAAGKQVLWGNVISVLRHIMIISRKKVIL